MGLLEDYFVPLYNFFLTPESFEQKVMTKKKKNLGGQNERFVTTQNKMLLIFCSPQVHNVAFAFELMQDGGLKKPKARPEGNLSLLFN